MQYNNQISFSNSFYKKVKIVNFEHEIWNSFHNLENWRTIDIVETHNSYSIVNNETQQVMLSYDNRWYSAGRHQLFFTEEKGKICR